MESSKVPINRWKDEDVKHWNTMEYYSTIKKNEILPSVTKWIDLESVILREIRQRKKNAVWFHLYVESKKQINKFRNITKQKKSYKNKKQTIGY